MQFSIARITIGAWLAVLALVLGATAYLFYFSQDHERLSQQRVPAYAGKLLAQQMEAITGDWSRATQAIAQSPMTLQLLQVRDETARRALLDQIISLHPQLGAIHVISSEQASGQKPISGNLNPQQLRVIDTAKSAQNKAPVLHVDALQLSLSEPIRSTDGSILGYVVVTRHLQEISALFAQSPLIDGYAELLQVSTNADILLKRGNEQLKTRAAAETQKIEGTPWRLALWPKAAIGVLGRDPWHTFLGFGAALTLLLTAIFGLAYRFTNRTLQRDLSTMTKLFSDISHDRMRKHYTITLKELKNAYQVMYQLGKLVVGKHLRMINSADTDHLSQVNNRRSFEAKQHQVFARVNEGWAHSLLILDIDNFKQVNDTFGHDAGDQLIVQFGKALKQHLRGSDFVTRLGGDEFCVIFPNTHLGKAQELAQRLRENLPKEIELRPDLMHAVSWSGGLSEYSRQDKSENAALARADQALLEAKRTGRDRTEVNVAAG